MENKIVLIEIERLHPHPKNPRKNIGDISELAESIKKSGVLQNLTVVPWTSELTGEGEDGQYTVVIGHRRMAAAKLAGLENLPCVIKEMSPAEQLATMLAENVQRNELTPLEQAEGIQMMFDLGESISDVVEKTGLSESTVRRRAKLLDMDRETLRATEGRGATLADYEKLNQIEDIKVRNEVLADIGTNNFNMSIETALKEQKKQKNKQKLFELLDTFAEKVTSYPPMSSYIKAWSYDIDDIKVNVPKDAETEKYYYYPNSYNVALYKKIKPVEKNAPAKETEKDRERREKEERERERKAKLEELAESAYKLRRKFIEDFNPAPRHGKEIKRFLWNMVCFAEYGPDKYEIDDLCGTSLNAGGTYEELSSMADEYFEAQPEKAMLQAAYLLFGDRDDEYIYAWSGEWCESESADRIYECLERLGYQMSDEEKKLQNGTHELFEREDD